MLCSTREAWYSTSTVGTRTVQYCPEPVVAGCISSTPLPLRKREKSQASWPFLLEYRNWLTYPSPPHAIDIIIPYSTVIPFSSTVFID